MPRHSEFRFNQVTGDWVIIATERAKRPEDYIIRVNRREMPPHVDTCPFCVGNEDMTDPVFAEPAEGAWLSASLETNFRRFNPKLSMK
jgi:UDPglucose--hexose-1-phosphate uridylyltransferase